MTTQVWFCDECKVVGRVETKESDIYSVAHAIGAAHRQSSPDCQTPTDGTRIINTSIVTDREALVLKSSIPRDLIAPLARLLRY
jgi:hypothetical protein